MAVSLPSSTDYMAILGYFHPTVTAICIGDPNVYANIQREGAIYATWNVDDKNANITLSLDNLTATTTVGDVSVRATQGISSGTAFWELHTTVAGGSTTGIATAALNLATFVGGDTHSWGFWLFDGGIFYDGGDTAYATPIGPGDVLGVGVNMDTSTLKFFKNGVDLGVAASGLTGTIYPATSVTVGGNVTANFGATPLVYPQSGYAPGVFIDTSPTPVPSQPVLDADRITLIALQAAAAAAAAAANIPWQTVTIDFGTVGVRSKVFTITDALVTPLNTVIVTQAADTSTKSVDELEMDDLIVKALPGNGEFILYATASPGPVSGIYKVNYLVR